MHLSSSIWIPSFCGSASGNGSKGQTRRFHLILSSRSLLSLGLVPDTWLLGPHPSRQLVSLAFYQPHPAPSTSNLLPRAPLADLGLSLASDRAPKLLLDLGQARSQMPLPSHAGATKTQASLVSRLHRVFPEARWGIRGDSPHSKNFCNLSRLRRD